MTTTQGLPQLSRLLRSAFDQWIKEYARCFTVFFPLADIKDRSKNYRFVPFSAVIRFPGPYLQVFSQVVSS